MAMVYILVVVKSLPPKAVTMVVVLCNDLHPSQSMNHMFSPAADHMHDSLCLHVPPIYERNSIGWLVLTLSSACSYTLHFGAH